MFNQDNKGFTLIELIVVIAIIAVLAVVLAPQYIQYVERGRESNDIQFVQNLVDAVNIVTAENRVRPTPDYPSSYSSLTHEEIMIIWDTASGISKIDDNDIGIQPLSTNLEFTAAIKEILGDGPFIPQSQIAKDNTLMITFNVYTGEAKLWGNAGEPNAWRSIGLNY